MTQPYCQEYKLPRRGKGQDGRFPGAGGDPGNPTRWDRYFVLSFWYRQLIGMDLSSLIHGSHDNVKIQMMGNLVTMMMDNTINYVSFNNVLHE